MHIHITHMLAHTYTVPTLTLRSRQLPCNCGTPIDQSVNNAGQHRMCDSHDHNDHKTTSCPENRIQNILSHQLSGENDGWTWGNNKESQYGKNSFFSCTDIISPNGRMMPGQLTMQGSTQSHKCSHLVVRVHALHTSLALHALPGVSADHLHHLLCQVQTAGVCCNQQEDTPH